MVLIWIESMGSPLRNQEACQIFSRPWLLLHMRGRQGRDIFWKLNQKCVCEEISGVGNVGMRHWRYYIQYVKCAENITWFYWRCRDSVQKYKCGWKLSLWKIVVLRILWGSIPILRSELENTVEGPKNCTAGVNIFYIGSQKYFVTGKNIFQQAKDIVVEAKILEAKKNCICKTEPIHGLSSN